MVELVFKFGYLVLVTLHLLGEDRVVAEGYHRLGVVVGAYHRRGDILKRGVFSADKYALAAGDELLARIDVAAYERGRFHVERRPYAAVLAEIQLYAALFTAKLGVYASQLYCNVAVGCDRAVRHRSEYRDVLLGCNGEPLHYVALNHDVADEVDIAAGYVDVAAYQQ